MPVNGIEHPHGIAIDVKGRLALSLEAVVDGGWQARSGVDVFPSPIKEGEHRPLWSFHTTHKRIFGKSTHFQRGSAKRPARGKGKRVFKHQWKEYGLTFKDRDRKGQPIPYFRLYDLRHTFLTRLGEEGVGEIELMHIAGWSSTRMASTYVHPSRRRLSRAIQKLDHAVAAD